MIIPDYTSDSPELRDQMRRQTIEEYRHRLREFEQRYELASERAEEEMARGRLRDTAETCEWVITYHAYLMLRNETIDSKRRGTSR